MKETIITDVNKQDDQYMVNLMDITPVKDQLIDENYENIQLRIKIIF